MSCPSPIALSETLAQCSIEPVTCLANGPACTDAPVNFGALIPFQELYFRDCNPTHTACPPNAFSQFVYLGANGASTGLEVRVFNLTTLAQIEAPCSGSRADIYNQILGDRIGIAFLNGTCSTDAFVPLDDFKSLPTFLLLRGILTYAQSKETVGLWISSDAACLPPPPIPAGAIVGITVVCLLVFCALLAVGLWRLREFTTGNDHAEAVVPPPAPPVHTAQWTAPTPHPALNAWGHVVPPPAPAAPAAAVAAVAAVAMAPPATRSFDVSVFSGWQAVPQTQTHAGWGAVSAAPVSEQAPAHVEPPKVEEPVPEEAHEPTTRAEWRAPRRGGGWGKKAPKM